MAVLGNVLTSGCMVPLKKINEWDIQMVLEAGAHTLVVPQASLTKALAARSAAAAVNRFPHANNLKIEGAKCIEDMLHLVFPKHVKCPVRSGLV